MHALHPNKPEVQIYDYVDREVSANLLLDIYDQLHRRRDLVAFADSLRADKTLLADKPTSRPN